MFEAEEAQKRGMIIVVMDHILHRMMAPIIGLAISKALFETAASEPHTEAMGIMVAPHFLSTCVVLQNG